MSLKNLFLISILGFLFACTESERADNELYIGTIAGPETKLAEVAKKVAQQQYGLNVKIIEFEDYVIPNTALAEGNIDANMFQHQPYLDIVVAKKDYPIESIAKTFIYPMGIYSKKLTSFQNLPKDLVIGIPNDPSNGARALRLLAKAKLISIYDVDDINLTPKQIYANPYNIKIKEIGAAQLARALEDLDAAVINTNFAIPAGLMPNKDAIFLESKDSPYANIIVVRSADKQQEKYSQLVNSFHSQDVLNEAIKLFSGQAIPAW